MFCAFIVNKFFKFVFHITFHICLIFLFFQACDVLVVFSVLLIYICQCSMFNYFYISVCYASAISSL